MTRLKRWFFPLLILMISLAVFLLNYKPGAFLVGWDNLFPEFNIVNNLQRDFFSVWQQYRGLGAIDNFAHASNIVHDVARLFLMTFLPLSLVRWVFMFLMQFLGGLGIYFLIVFLLHKDHKEHTSVRLVAFFGSLFYQYNLGTIQQFFLPLEVFVVHFAFLPWLILFTLAFLETGKKKHLISLFIVSLVATPQAYVPTVFAVYLLTLILILFSIIVLGRFEKTRIKRALLVIALTFGVNAFWILPTGYAYFNTAKTVYRAKNYQMASNDIYYRNRKYGNFADTALIKGVPLSFQATDYATNTTHYMMWPWLNHINTLWFSLPAWTFFLLLVFGLFNIAKHREKKLIPFTVVFLFCFGTLGTEIPLIGDMFALWRSYFPIVHTVFRFIFTKFSIVYVLAYTLILSAGLFYLIAALNKALYRKIAGTIFLVLLFLYSAPAFQGHFYYENLAVPIPDDYMQAFSFFQNENINERVAILPIPWYWAWAQPKWGTINSGFIWFGIPQSITDLAFTPWGRENENYYWELNRAVYTKDSVLLRNVLEKYDISWVYLDKNTVNAPGKKLSYDDYDNLLNQIDGISLYTTAGQIYIYKYAKKATLHDFIGLKNKPPVIDPGPAYDDYDSPYVNEGDYRDGLSPDVYYPYRSLFSGKNPADIEYEVYENNSDIVVRTRLPKTLQGYTLQTPTVPDEEFVDYKKDLSIEVYMGRLSLDDKPLINASGNNTMTQSVTLPTYKDGFLELRIDKKAALSYASSTDTSYLSQKNDSCEKNEKGLAQLDNKNGFTFVSVDSNNCVRIELPYLYHRFGYLLNINATNDDKRGLHLDLVNSTTNQSDLETYLDNDGRFHRYFLSISPRSFYGLGYTLYINNISEGNERVTNTVNDVNVYKIPYFFLKNIRIYNPKTYSSFKKDLREESNIIQVDHPTNDYYSVTLDNQTLQEGTILYLSQAYNVGWKAYSDGREIKEHRRVNNWANGWLLDSRPSTIDHREENTDTIRKSKIEGRKSIVLIFWPQYLEYAGFFILGLTVIYVLRHKKAEEPLL